MEVKIYPRAVVGLKGIWLMSVMAFALCLGRAFAGETLGLWTFEGAGGSEIEDETVLPNQIQGSTLVLETGRIAGNSTTFAPLPIYTNDVPSAHLFVDGTMTNRIGEVGMSIHLQNASMVNTASRKAGSFLRVKNFGALVKGKSFTIEAIMRLDNDYPHNSNGLYGQQNVICVSREGAAAPTIGFDAHSQGRITYTIGGEEKTTWANGKTQSGRTQFENRWRHCALIWNEDSKQLRLCADYWDYSVVNGTSISQLAIEDDSFVQILGVGHSDGSSLFAGNVAAVRISEGVLDPAEMMTVWHEAEPTVMAHWRFEGEPSSEATNMSSEVASFDWSSLVPYADKNFTPRSASYSSLTWFPFYQVERNADYRVNGTALASVLNGKSGHFLTRGYDLPAYWADGFTFEIIFKVDSSYVDKDGNTKEKMPFAIWTPRDNKMWYLRYNNNQYQFRVFDANGDSQYAVINRSHSEATPVYDVWHHLVATYDIKNHKISLWVDGVSSTTVDISGTYMPFRPSATPFGKNPYCNLACPDGSNIGTGEFHGLIDEVRIVRGVLPPEKYLVGKNHQRTGLLIMMW